MCQAPRWLSCPGEIRACWNQQRRDSAGIKKGPGRSHWHRNASAHPSLQQAVKLGRGSSKGWQVPLPLVQPKKEMDLSWQVFSPNQEITPRGVEE